MAEVPVLVPIGPDIMAGFLAKLSDVPPDKLVQWYGTAALGLTSWPLNAPMPGVRAWQHKRPYATTETRNIVAAPSPTVVTLDGAPLVSPDDLGTWLYVSISSTGQGQYKRITAIAGSDVTVQEAFNPSLVAEPFFIGSGQVAIIRDSHRVAAGSTGTRIFRHTSTPAFQSSDVGKAALFFAAYDGDPVNLTRDIIAQDGVSITLDSPLLFDSGSPGAPPLDSGFVVLTGGDLPSDAVQTLAGFANGAALRPMALRLDDAPVNVDGYSYNAADTGTPFASPLAELGVKAMVAAAGASTVTVERSVFNSLLDQGSLVKVGTQTRVITQVNSPIQVTVDSPWGVVPSAGDRLILVRASVNCVAQLAFRMRSRFATPMVVAELGTIATMISPFVFAPGPTQPSWAHDLTSLDWHPSSPASMFVALRAMLTSVKALIAGEGNTAKFYVFIDASNDAIEGRYQHIGEHLTVVRDAIRDHVEDDEMPFIIAGPSTYGSGPPDLRPAIYEQLAAMAAKDPWTGFFDNRDGVGKAFDNARLSAAGQITTADRFADTLIALLERNAAPPQAAPAATPADIIARIDAAVAEALADGLPLVSFPGNGGQIVTMTPKEAAELRDRYVVALNRQSGVRRTLASFGGGR